MPHGGASRPRPRHCLPGSQQPRPYRPLPQTSALGTCRFQVGWGVLSRAVLSPVIPLRRSPPGPLPQLLWTLPSGLFQGRRMVVGDSLGDLGPPVVLGTVALPPAARLWPVTPLPQGGGTSTSGFAASWGLPSPNCKHNRQVSHKKSSGGSFYWDPFVPCWGCPESGQEEGWGREGFTGPPGPRVIVGASLKSTGAPLRFLPPSLSP